MIVMSPQRYQRLKEVFLEACDLEPRNREAFLQQACAGDEELKSHVEVLLADDEVATATLGSPAVVAQQGAHANEPGRPPPCIPDYELIVPVGRGALGEVWLGRNRFDESHCAIKLLSSTAAVELEGLREYKRRVAEHPHLMRIEHVGEAGDLCYYVMPLADDACATSPVIDPHRYEPLSLARHLDRHGRMELHDVVDLGRQMLSAVGHMHENGARHGDVKPANILRVRGRWQLADHGLVGSAESGEALGCTPAYCPPEGPGGPEADLYALGVTLFEAATGAKAPRLSDFLVGALEIPDGDPRSQELAALIRQTCALARSQRFTRAADMLEALEAIDARRAIAGEATWHLWTRPWPWVAAACVATAALVLVTLVARRQPTGVRVPGAGSSSLGATVAPFSVSMQLAHYRGPEETRRRIGWIGLNTREARFRDDSVGTIKLIATALAAPTATFDTSGGNAPLGGIDGGDGRVLLGHNLAGPVSVGAITGADPEFFGGPQESISGDSSRNAFIADLTGGAEIYGLTGLSATDLASNLSGAPQNAIAALLRLDVGPAGYDDNYAGFDMVLLVNLADLDLGGPAMGAVAPGFMVPLMTRGFAGNPTFGGAGPVVLAHLSAGAVWATLVPESAGLALLAHWGACP